MKLCKFIKHWNKHHLQPSIVYRLLIYLRLTREPSIHVKESTFTKSCPFKISLKFHIAWSTKLLDYLLQYVTFFQLPIADIKAETGCSFFVVVLLFFLPFLKRFTVGIFLTYSLYLKFNYYMRHSIFCTFFSTLWHLYILIYTKYT